MDDLPESVAASELQAGERLLWSAKPLVPAAGPLILAALPISFFGLFFAGFAAFWICGAAGFHAPNLHPKRGPDFFRIVFPLFGLPFLLAGLGMVTSPLWAAVLARRMAAKTVYAVTDRRVLVIVGDAARKVLSFDGAQIGGQLDKTERPDGSGDIVFTAVNPGLALIQGASGSSAGQAALRRGGARLPGLYGVPDVRSVERILLDAFKKKS